MRGMQMHHRARGTARLVERGMQWYFLGRRVAGGEPPVGVEPRQPSWVERTERGVCRGQQPAAVVNSDADVARGARCHAALEYRAAQATDFLTDLCFGHGCFLVVALSHA